MPLSNPLLAFWSFASAWMLLWGLAAVVPLAIHLWSRRQFQRTSWAAMEFLLAAIQKNSRRIAVQQWLLLALRMSVLLCFAVALAGPLFSWTGFRSPIASPGKTFTLLVIDASLSMDYRSADRSRFDAARDLARKIVMQSSQGEAFSLLLLADPPQPIIRQPAFDPENVLEEISALKVSDGQGDLVATLSQAVEILESTALHQAQFSSRRVVFLTDLEQTTWENVTSATCRAPLARLADLATLTLADLGASETGNLAVAELHTARSLVLPGQPVEFQAVVHNFKSQAATRAAVELHVDGKRVQEESAELPTGGSATLRFSHTFDAAREYMVEARVRDSRLPADNSRWLVVPIRDALRVLCLEGRPGEARRLALALEPQQADRRRIIVVTAADSTLLDQDLTAFDVVCACNVPRFSTGEAQMLKSFLVQGGGLMIFLGDQVQADNYNAILGESPDSNGQSDAILPAAILEPVSGSQYAFDPLEYRHPVLGAFRGHEQSGLLTTPVWKYFQLKPQGAAQTVLGFVDGDPALVAGQVGQGRTLLFASAVSPLSMDRSRNPPLPWSALDSWPSFPPLMQEMVEYVVAGDAARKSIVIGDELTGVLPANGSGGSVTIIMPTGQTEQALLTQRGSEAVWSFQPHERAGPYQAQYEPSGVRELFAVNVNTRESELVTFDPELLPEQFGREIRDDAATAAARLEPPRSWFRWFLFAVLGLLAAESLVAWGMSR